MALTDVWLQEIKRKEETPELLQDAFLRYSNNFGVSGEEIEKIGAGVPISDRDIIAFEGLRLLRVGKSKQYWGLQYEVNPSPDFGVGGGSRAIILFPQKPADRTVLVYSNRARPTQLPENRLHSLTDKLAAQFEQATKVKWHHE